MFNSKNETVTGEEVLNILIESYYEIEPYTGESDIIHELKKALNGEDSFGLGEHAITVSMPEAQFLEQLAKSTFKSVSKWPKNSIDEMARNVAIASESVHEEIDRCSGSTPVFHGLRASHDGVDTEWKLVLVTVNSARLACYKKRKTLGEASLLYGFFECLRLRKLNKANRANMPIPPKS